MPWVTSELRAPGQFVGARLSNGSPAVGTGVRGRELSPARREAGAAAAAGWLSERNGRRDRLSVREVSVQDADRALRCSIVGDLHLRHTAVDGP
jgi:hypothetical protein